jgi:hypothetical protein
LLADVAVEAGRLFALAQVQINHYLLRRTAGDRRRRRLATDVSTGVYG